MKTLLVFVLIYLFSMNVSAQTAADTVRQSFCLPVTISVVRGPISYGIALLKRSETAWNW